MFFAPLIVANVGMLSAHCTTTRHHGFVRAAFRPVAVPPSFAVAYAGTMSSSSSSGNADSGAVSRRELAAFVAERRIIENARKIASLSKGGPVDGGTRGGKRNAPGGAAADAASDDCSKEAEKWPPQVSFSDDSDDDEVTCVGVDSNKSIRPQGEGGGQVERGAKKRPRIGDLATGGTKVRAPLFGLLTLWRILSFYCGTSSPAVSVFTLLECICPQGN